MPTYQADAVVLRRLDYGEADRILTLLTREHGKLAAIAKGSRRATTRMGNGLDLFTRSQMMLAKGRNLDVVAQVQRLDAELIDDGTAGIGHRHDSCAVPVKDPRCRLADIPEPLDHDTRIFD